MADRFTEEATRVLKLADVEARRCNHECVGTEHILLAVLRAGDSAAARALERLGIELRAARLVAEQAATAGPEPAKGAILPRTPRLRVAVERATAEASALRLSEVSPELLLLALLSDDEGLAAQVLIGLGHRPDGVRAAVLADPDFAACLPPPSRAITAEAPAVPPTATDDAIQPAARVDHLRPETRQASLPAPTGAPDVSLAAIDRPVTRSTPLTVLAHIWNLLLYFLGLKPASAFEVGLPRAAFGDPHLPADLRLGPPARAILRLADREARQLRHEYIGTEHLLLGIAREGNCTAARALSAFGLTLHRVRHEVLKVVRDRAPMPLPRRLPVTPRAQGAMRRAAYEAHCAGLQEVAPEHLLLGLLQEEHGVASHVLITLGVTNDRLNKEIGWLKAE